jgi:geranylgeranyl diphosphate synthase type II
MIGGQVIDLAGEGKRLSLDTLLKLHANKTGALIAVSAELGCIAAGLSREDARTCAARAFAQSLGLAFQIVDDVLDATSDTQTLGKSVGSDERSGKTTFLTYYSPKEAMDYATRVTQNGKSALDGMEGNAFLLALADHLLNRKS